MSTDSWLTGASGDWNTAADWSGGTPPTASVAAIIADPGSYVVTLFGTASAAAVTLSASGAEFYDAGGITVGGTFALQAGTLALADGAVNGGTLAMEGGLFLSTGGQLNGVAVQGVLALTAPDASLFVQDGLALSGAGGIGAGSLALTGAYAAIDFLGSQTLNNATVSLGATGGAPADTGPATLAIIHAGGATTGATLTLGAGLSLRESGQAALSIGNAGPPQGATLPDALINQGSIVVNGVGSLLTVAGSGLFDNQGSIFVSGGSTLALAAGGFDNTGQITVSNATLAFGGTFAAASLADLGNVTLSAGQVALTGTAELDGGTLSVGAGTAMTGSLGALSLAGTLQGGTVLDAGGGLKFTAGTGELDAVSYVGALTLSAAGAAVTLTGGSEVAGTIAVTGSGASLLLQGSETLNGTAISLGGAGAAASIATTDPLLASTATTATLGAGVTVQQTGAAAALYANGLSPVPGLGQDDSLVNQGVVTAAYAGGDLAISGYGTFINQGSMAVSNADSLTITVQDFGNDGTLTAGPSGVLILGTATNYFGASPAWSNAGLLSVNGGTLVMNGAVTLAQLGSITQSGGGSIIMAGTLEAGGGTLSLGPGGPPGFSLPSLSLAGTISGGSIADPDGVLAPAAAGAAVLDGVSYLGTLALTETGAVLTVRDGFSLSGTAELLGAGCVLDCQGSETIAAGQILLGAAAAQASLHVSHSPTASGGSTLTLGTGVAITQAGALAGIGEAAASPGDAIVNHGQITAGIAGGIFTLGGPDFINTGRLAVSNGDTLSISAGQFSNSGSISVLNGELALTGNIALSGLGQVTLTNSSMAVSGTLALGNGTLAIGLGSAIGRLLLTGTLYGGTVADAGSGLACSAGATLEDVIYAGLLDLSRPFAQLDTSGGLTLTGTSGSGAGSILLTGAQSRLIVTGTETIDHAQISLGSVSQTYLGQRLAAPELAAAAQTQLTLGTHATLTLAGTGGVLGDSGLGDWTDAIVNDGRISAATSGGTLTIGSSAFSNAGSIAATGGGIITLSDTGITNTGVLSVGASSAIQVSLYDFYAAPDPGATVLTNAGTIAMQGGIFQEVTANGLFPSVPIANLPGGVLSGFGLVFAPVQNSGTIAAKGGTLVLEQAVSGAGTLQIAATGTLELAAGIAAGQTVSFAGSGATLRLDQPASFAGTLAGFTSGDVIDLPGTVLTGVGLSSGTLVASTATANTRLLSTVPLAGALSSGRDSHGGATITITPQKIGSGTATLAVPQSSMLFWASPAGDLFKGVSADLNGAHISNWSAADAVDFTDLASSSAALSVSQTTGLTTLLVSDGTHTASIGLTGSFSAQSFTLTSNGTGGTELTYSPHG
jgi:hypothetical protein